MYSLPQVSDIIGVHLPVSMLSLLRLQTEIKCQHREEVACWNNDEAMNLVCIMQVENGI